MGPLVPVGGDSCGGAEALGGAVLVRVGGWAAGALLGPVDLAKNRSATANPPENNASNTEPRACTM